MTTDNKIEEIIEFARKEHIAGFHDKIEKNCPECAKQKNHPIDSLSAITGIKLSDMLGK